MYKAFNITYLVNMVIQGFWCLLFPIGVAFGIGWLFVNKLSWPGWVYVPLLVVATVIGLISMCRFLISSAEAMDRIEKERAQRREQEREKMQKNAIESTENVKTNEDIDPSETEKQEGGDDK